MIMRHVNHFMKYNYEIEHEFGQHLDYKENL